MSEIKTLKSKNFTWFSIYDAKADEINFLRKKFHFHELDLEDAYAKKQSQRPKIDVRENYIFLVFLFPYYNAILKKIEPKELDVFITKDHFITLQNIHKGEVTNFFAECQKKPNLIKGTPFYALYQILNRLYKICFPMLDHISLDINHIEDNIYAKKERQIVEKILAVKRNIMNFLKIMQPHKRILRKISTDNFSFSQTEKELPIWYNDLIDLTKNIWDTLANYQQTIDNLEDTNNILVSFKLNDIMKTLTIFSVIVFPLTLMAAIFGMNVADMPIVGSPNDFWIILTIMLIASICMFSYFRHKKWF